ncbi:endonuclease V [Nonomuraea spiralis]|uniref:Endonuclease V n=1 Tax=Nonomuraea spiralis TaxID=46182 RepID=A0ABV5IQ14_9ACTN|nr:endonuclease V [Nonomuraea spiralis]GGT11185.1 hypothetical protein GCM10010176_064690 [Nonomuraea spiralis]
MGEHEPPGRERGDWTPIVHEGVTVGRALRTRRDTKPVYVSQGHRIGLEYQAKRIMTSADVIADDLWARITSGELRLHHRFPTERELIEHYDSNTEVVRAAKSLLIDEGLIGRAGRGAKAGLTVLRTPPTTSA